MVIGVTSILEIITIVLSAIIIGWIIKEQNIFAKKFRGSRSLFYVSLAMLFGLFDLLLHEFEEITIIPYSDLITSFNHLAMLFLSVTALLIVHREQHKGKD